ncbi:Calreticulin domain containing protein [Trichuris trichiura]|uniref:Calreticulin n=1 Tax=Trichuris trichiura TaxID=36087 RepID=A0A077YYB3_TRITR|nr:Calreticulin domain containing protein [Trichuris trichiura]
MLVVNAFLLLLNVVLALGTANVYLEERFDDGDGWKNRWVQSKHRSDYGVFIVSHGKFYGDEQVGVGLQTTQNSKFYAVSRKFDIMPDSLSGSLVIQFSVKHEQKIDCGGGYIKILSGKVNQTDFHNNSSYYIMFGPDICADSKVLQMILKYNDTYFKWAHDVKCKSDRLTHLYTLVIHQNLTYKVLVDLKIVKSGLLLEDLQFLVPESKSDLKTDFPKEKGQTSTDNSDRRSTDADRKVTQSTCSRDSETRTVKPKFMDLNFYKSIGAVGIDVWQVKAGTIFDNILVTDNENYAIRFAKKTWQLYNNVMSLPLFLITLFSFVANVDPNVYLYERFDDGDAWKNRWVQSSHNANYGLFKRSYGRYFANWRDNMGIQTSQNARFYALSRKLDTIFDSRNKTFVLQYSVKHEQNIECGGAYIKVLSAETDLNDFNELTPYYIMFGPDICGYERKIHVFFGYKGKNLEIDRELPFEADNFTHVYTLMIFSNLTYKVLIDQSVVRQGKLEDGWRFLPQKFIKDPAAKKPDDWDMRKTIIDENDTKPEDWDKPETILDPNAVKPDDWNDEVNGEWQPPEIPNPEYKGEWKPREIKNPNYKGTWSAPYIHNPEYVADPYLAAHEDVGAVGFEIWQMKCGTIFDNILITDDPQFAEKVANETWRKYVDLEKLRFNEYLEKKRRRKEMAEEAKKQEKEIVTNAEYDNEQWDNNEL